MYVHIYIYMHAYTHRCYINTYMRIYIYIYICLHIYIYIYNWYCYSTTSIGPDTRTGWRISFENTESGAGSRFLLLGRMAKAQAKGVCFSQTPVKVFDLPNLKSQ